MVLICATDSLTLHHRPSGCSLGVCSRIPPRTYHYLTTPMNWTNAQSYCREKYTDLATIESLEDLHELDSSFSYGWSWIGLQDDPKSWKETMGHEPNSWRWSATGETSRTGFHAWNTGQPDRNGGKEACVLMGAGGKWSNMECQASHSFVCYTGKRRFALVDFNRPT